ncbi:MAG: hypothetical protein ACRETG_08810, partial [Steroidobacteraceae bacterium]
VHASAPEGFLAGHLKIVSLQEVELGAADAGSPPLAAKTLAPAYAGYPLIVLSKDGKQEIARVTADGRGNYRVKLPPGDYILDAKGRAPQRLRAKPHPFTVIANQTVRVDMDIDTGIR